MKRILSWAVMLLSIGLQAQVGINTTDPKGTLDVHYSAEWESTGKAQGIIPPKMNTVQRNAMQGIQEGLMIFNIDYNCLQVFNGTAWSCADGTHKQIPPVVGGATATLGNITPLQWFAVERNGTYYNIPQSDILPNSSVSVEIPYSNATNGDYAAYEQTFTLPDKNGVQRQFKLSYPSGTITGATGTLTATLTNISGSTYEPQPQTPNGQFNDLKTIQVTFNGAGSAPFKIQAMGGIPDKKFGDGVHDFVYLPVEVTSPNGYNKTWLNMNLGAEAAKLGSPSFNMTLELYWPEVKSEESIYGSLYQWQRPTDGHELRNSQMATTLADNWQATSPLDVVGKFIVETSSGHYGEWVLNSIQATGSTLELWQHDTENNPCPSGFHVPLEEEWKQFVDAMSPRNFSTQTMLPNMALAGYRRPDLKSLQGEGSSGVYWHSSKSNDDYLTPTLWFSSPNGVYDYKERSWFNYGCSVRCIKD